MNRQPKLMNFSRMRSILEPHIQQLHERLFINRELVIVYGDPHIFRLIASQQPPFTIDDHRLGIVTRGEARVNVNLVEKHFTAGMLVFLGPGTIISPESLSPDLEIFGVGLSAAFPMPFAPGTMPAAFNGSERDFQLPATAHDQATARHIVDTLWHLVHHHDYNSLTAASLVAALMHHYDGLYRRHHDQLLQSQPREQTLFDRFIYLVNRHSLHEHQLGFYARRMCITERYLSTVVRQASGTPAKEWIDRSRCQRIQVELKHTDKPIARIAEETGFPNPSFFTKFFRRMTGLTPGQYRAFSLNPNR